MQGVLIEKEKQIRDALGKLDDGKAGSLSIEELVSVRRELAESKILVDQHTKTIEALSADKESLEKKKKDLESRFGTLEQEQQELLDKTIAEEESRNQKGNVAETVSALKVILQQCIISMCGINMFNIDQARKRVSITERNPTKGD